MLAAAAVVAASLGGLEAGTPGAVAGGLAGLGLAAAGCRPDLELWALMDRSGVSDALLLRGCAACIGWSMTSMSLCCHEVDAMRARTALDGEACMQRL
jgi:hypothetical protein